MSEGIDHKVVRRQLRKVVGEDVAINVLEMRRFIRRGFWQRLGWLLFGR